jgi:hypothetical protein
MSHYHQEDVAQPRTKRFIVEARDRTPGPDQPSLFDPPQGDQAGQSNREKWEQFKRCNPGVVLRIWDIALAEASAGQQRISTKRIFEMIRAEGLHAAGNDEPWAINNSWTALCADDLCADHRLAGKIERRARRLQ